MLHSKYHINFIYKTVPYYHDKILKAKLWVKTKKKAQGEMEEQSRRERKNGQHLAEERREQNDKEKV